MGKLGDLLSGVSYTEEPRKEGQANKPEQLSLALIGCKVCQDFGWVRLLVPCVCEAGDERREYLRLVIADEDHLTPRPGHRQQIEEIPWHGQPVYRLKCECGWMSEATRWMDLLTRRPSRRRAAA
jgi:hypothetical protein